MIMLITCHVIYELGLSTHLSISLGEGEIEGIDTAAQLVYEWMDEEFTSYDHATVLKEGRHRTDRRGEEVLKKGDRSWRLVAMRQGVCQGRSYYEK